MYYAGYVILFPVCCRVLPCIAVQCCVVSCSWPYQAPCLIFRVLFVVCCSVLLLVLCLLPYACCVILLFAVCVESDLLRPLCLECKTYCLEDPLPCVVCVLPRRTNLANAIQRCASCQDPMPFNNYCFKNYYHSRPKQMGLECKTHCLECKTHCLGCKTHCLAINFEMQDPFS